MTRRSCFLPRAVPLAAALLVLAVAAEAPAQFRGGGSRGGLSLGFGRGYPGSYGRGFSGSGLSGFGGYGLSGPGLYGSGLYGSGLSGFGGYGLSGPGLYSRGYYQPAGYAAYGYQTYGYAPSGHGVYSPATAYAAPATVYSSPGVAYSAPAPADTGDLGSAPPTLESRGYYNPADVSGRPGSAQGSPQAPADGSAHIQVRVPGNAQVWIEGEQTTRTGPAREFVSPRLAPGKDYQYEVKARWTENGRTVDQVRSATVRANQTTVVDFTQPAPARPGAAADDVPSVP